MGSLKLMPRLDFETTRRWLLSMLSFFIIENSNASNINISGVITNVNGSPVSGATVVFNHGNSKYMANSLPDGSYSISFVGISDVADAGLSIGQNYPNPFSDIIYIPFRTNKKGNLFFEVYNLVGQKIYEKSYNNLHPGSYNLAWSGNDQAGVSAQQGIYLYHITFNGKTVSGKMIKMAGSYTSSNVSNDLNALEEALDSKLKSTDDIGSAMQFSVDVSKNGFYRIVRTDLSINGDTIINFVLAEKFGLPYKT